MLGTKTVLCSVMSSLNLNKLDSCVASLVTAANIIHSVLCVKILLLGRTPSRETYWYSFGFCCSAFDLEGWFALFS